MVKGNLKDQIYDKIKQHFDSHEVLEKYVFNEMIAEGQKLKSNFPITLLFEKINNETGVVGVQLIKNIPYTKIQFFKNKNIVSEYPVSVIEKQSFRILMFRDTPIILGKMDKLGIVLI